MSGYIGNRTGVVTVTSPELDSKYLQPTGDGSGLTGINAFKPTTVSGTTPSLDVGSFNYFNNGTLSADTTVSFSSIPTEARWSYSFEVGASSLYFIEGAVYQKNLNVGGQDTQPESLFFKPDGTKMYVVGSVGDDVNEYNLSTAWEVDTASYVQNFDISSQDFSPTGIFFKPDGTKMYMLGLDTDSVYQYSLSTAWNVSTASYDSVSFSVFSQQTYPYEIFFKPDGTKMYIAGGISTIDTPEIHQYTLSTPWALNTASYDSISFNLEGQMSSGVVLTFSSDGSKMFAGTPSDIFRYSLSTNWNVSTASYDSVSFTTPDDTRSLVFNPEGTLMYTLDVGAGGLPEYVRQYSSAELAALTLPASIENPPSISAALGDRVTYDFFTVDSGTTVTLISEEVIPQ